MIALMSHTYIDLYCGNGAAAWQRINAQWPAVKGSHLLVVQVISESPDQSAGAQRTGGGPGRDQAGAVVASRRARRAPAGA